MYIGVATADISVATDADGGSWQGCYRARHIHVRERDIQARIIIPEIWLASSVALDLWKYCELTINLYRGGCTQGWLRAPITEGREQGGIDV